MRILNSVIGDASGGRWQVVCEYSRVLQRHGHQVLMLLGHKQPDLRGVPAGVQVEVIRSHGHYDYLAAAAAARRLRGFGPQIGLAHCSRSVALLKRALAGYAPLVAVSHSNKVKRLLPADAYVALSPHIRDRLVSASGTRLAKPCFVIPNMIAVDASMRLPVRARHEPPRIVALGRFDTVKGLDVFIRALAQLQQQGREFAATLAGAGAEEARLRRLVTELGLRHRVSMPGWVEDVETLLSRAVLSRASGHLEMFAAEREALFCDIDDPDSTARQMARIMDDRALAERLRHAAFERASARYSVPVVTAQILHALETILEKWHKDSVL
jgi:glycosyltransferase involved in cell wall biosynthesis